MTIYDDMQKVASDLLSEFDQTEIHLITVTPGNGPEDDPGEPTKTLTKLDAVSRGVSFKYVSNGFATASDLQVTFGVIEGLEPTEKDFIKLGETEHKIVKIFKKPPTGVTVAYTVIVNS